MDNDERQCLEPDDLTPNEVTEWVGKAEADDIHEAAKLVKDGEDPKDTFARWCEENWGRVEAIAAELKIEPNAWLRQTLDLCVDADERLIRRPARPPQTHRPRTDGIRDPQGRI